MTSNPWFPRLAAFILGVLLMPGTASWAQITLSEGDFVIEAVRFEGLQGLNAEELRARLGSRANRRCEQKALNSDIRIIERSLQDCGYTYAKVIEVRMEPVTPDSKLLVFVILAGDLYHVSKVRLTGNHAFAAAEIAPTTHVTVGKLYTASAIMEDRKMITGFYGARGYADLNVDVMIRETDRGEVEIVYELTEGGKSLLNAVHITGNAHVRQEAIRAEFKLAPGDVYNTALIEQGRQALLKTGLFEVVEASSSPAEKPGFKNLEISVVEK